MSSVVASGQPTAQRVRTFLELEARALLTRLDLVKPFALIEPMVPAASLLPDAQFAIERHLLSGRRDLRRDVRRYLAWLRGPGRACEPPLQQRRFTLLKLRFNAALAQLDIFAEAIGQRSEHDTGVWLSGLDVAAHDALTLPGGLLDPPPILCYLHRGLGGAIRRAHTRLPGGGASPVAVIRIPRERMVGFGIASSLVHEVGHQAAALLGLVGPLRAAIEERRRTAPAEDRIAWTLWGRWISEIVADLWAVACIGIASTLGLVSIVSLPRAFVFRVGEDDPHPFPWIRVLLSCGIGHALYPHRQWRDVADAWTVLYPPSGLAGRDLQLVTALRRTSAAFVRLLLDHRSPGLGGLTLGQALRRGDRDPEQLTARYAEWTARPGTLRAAPPTLVFAVLGRARATGRLTPELESRLLRGLIARWALWSTLQLAGSHAITAAIARRQLGNNAGRVAIAC